MSQPTAPASPKKAKLAAALKRNMARRKAVSRLPLPVADEGDAGTGADSSARSALRREPEGRGFGGDTPIRREALNNRAAARDISEAP